MIHVFRITILIFSHTVLNLEMHILFLEIKHQTRAFIDINIMAI